MVLIKRGGCSFMEKSYNAQNHGAVGAIIYNNDENDIDSNIDMVNDESGRQIDIPVLWLVGRNGHMMVDSMLDVSQIQSCKFSTGSPLNIVSRNFIGYLVVPTRKNPADFGTTKITEKVFMRFATLVPIRGDFPDKNVSLITVIF